MLILKVIKLFNNRIAIVLKIPFLLTNVFTGEAAILLHFSVILFHFTENILKSYSLDFKGSESVAGG